MYDTIDEARTALENAFTDCEGDFGAEAVEEAAFDLIHSVADNCTKEVRAELLRTELGITDEDEEIRLANELFDGGEFSRYEGATK
jgi:hypothetical protein